MESILDYLKRKLSEVGSARWEEISMAAGVTKSLPRKLAYERENPGVVTIQPLYDYFRSVDAGLERFPWEGGRREPPSAKVAQSGKRIPEAHGAANGKPAKSTDKPARGKGH